MRENNCQNASGECRLEAADILLVHTKRSLWASVIRLGTHCYWNHAAIVCRAPDAGYPSKGALLVDARTDGGVVIRPAEHYLGHPDKYTVGIKRLDAGWSEMRPPAEKDLLGDVCNLAVSEVNINVGLPVAEHLDKALRQITVVLRFLKRKLRRIFRPPTVPWNIHPLEVKAFTCAGFVQWCYYIAAVRAVGGTDNDIAKRLVFNPRAEDQVTPFELLTTTPADLAECNSLSWKFVG